MPRYTVWLEQHNQTTGETHKGYVSPDMNLSPDWVNQFDDLDDAWAAVKDFVYGKMAVRNVRIEEVPVYTE